MRCSALALVVITVSVATGDHLLAQSALIDHWQTASECLSAVDAPFYLPSIKKVQSLGADEIVRGHPTGGCVNMDLPDRPGGRGWVKIETGREFVYKRSTSQILKLAECSNKVYGVSPFPPARGERGLRGPIGPQGQVGPMGPEGLQGSPGKVVVKKNNFPWLKATLIGTVVGVGGYCLVRVVRDKPCVSITLIKRQR